MCPIALLLSVLCCYAAWPLYVPYCSGAVCAVLQFFCACAAVCRSCVSHTVLRLWHVPYDSAAACALRQCCCTCGAAVQLHVGCCPAAVRALLPLRSSQYRVPAFWSPLCVLFVRSVRYGPFHGAPDASGVVFTSAHLERTAGQGHWFAKRSKVCPEQVTCLHLRRPEALPPLLTVWSGGMGSNSAPGSSTPRVRRGDEAGVCSHIR